MMAEGQYEKGVGITIKKGTTAKVRFKGTIHTGKIDEEILIGVAAMGMRPAKSTGIRRITH